MIAISLSTDIGHFLNDENRQSALQATSHRAEVPFQWHHRQLLCKSKWKKQKGPKLSHVLLFHQKIREQETQSLLSVMHRLSFWNELTSVLDSSAGGEGYCVLAENHMACLCLDTSYKQGLMSLLVQHHSGHSQTWQQQRALQHTPGLFRGFSSLNDRKTQFPQFVSTILWHTWVFWHTWLLFLCLTHDTSPWEETF